MSDAIYSSLLEDPDMAELVEMFVSEIPEKIDRLRQAIREEDLDAVTRFAHQLKGASGGYGFESLTPIAENLERVASGVGHVSETEVAALEVVSYLQRIRV